MDDKSLKLLSIFELTVLKVILKRIIWFVGLSKNVLLK